MTVWYDSAALRAQLTIPPQHRAGAVSAPRHVSLDGGAGLCARCYAPESAFDPPTSQRDQLIAALHRLKSLYGALECAVLMVRIDVEEQAASVSAGDSAHFDAVRAALRPLGDVFRFGQCFLICIQDSKEAVEDSILHIRALVQAALDERAGLKLDVFSIDPVLATLEG